MINQALFSSDKTDWCTPQQFFNKEFHFVLDAAATYKTSKCEKCFTPKEDGLSQSWDVGGGQCTATLRMVDILPANG